MAKRKVLQTPAAESPEMSRRDFMRQSAEAAALTLFGTLALDEVINKVLTRVNELRGIDRLARQTARHLGGVAFAETTSYACAPPYTYGYTPG
jgi:hypothetical protein